ncbi:unnamed protein product [Chrysoparadoxa australica]
MEASLPPSETTWCPGPFSHQVGGHFPLLAMGDGKIGKPALDAEVHFYEHILPHYPRLRSLVPSYLGCIELDLGEVWQLGNRVAAAAAEEWEQVGCEPSGKSDPTELSRSETETGFKRKLWQKFLRRYSVELSANNANGRVPIMLLEDLTSPFREPCILDIKLGRAPIGKDDQVPSAKLKRQRWKCLNTTTGPLALRLNGMQVWQKKTATYRVKDKYWGQGIRENTLLPALKAFFDNGERIRIEVIRHLLGKLSEVEVALREARSYSLYSSSVLLIYDGVDADAVNYGDLMGSGTRERVLADVRVIDFAKGCQEGPVGMSNEEPGSIGETDGAGLLLGLQNLQKLLAGVLAGEGEEDEVMTVEPEAELPSEGDAPPAPLKATAGSPPSPSQSPSHP